MTRELKENIKKAIEFVLFLCFSSFILQKLIGVSGGFMSDFVLLFHYESLFKRVTKIQINLLDLMILV